MKLLSIALLFCMSGTLARPMPMHEGTEHAATASSHSSSGSADNSHSEHAHNSSLASTSHADDAEHHSSALSSSHDHAPSYSLNSTSSEPSNHYHSTSGSSHPSSSSLDSSHSHTTDHASAAAGAGATSSHAGHHHASADSSSHASSSLSAPATANPSMGEIQQTDDSMNKRTQLFVYQCIRAMPNFEGNLKKIQEGILNCSINAWALALREQPNATPIRNLYNSLVKEQKTEAALDEDQCASDSVNHFLGVDLLFSAKSPSCMSTLKTCIAGAVETNKTDKNAGFSSRLYCLSDAYLCTAPGYRNSNQKMYNMARLAADKFTKLSLAFTGLQKCEGNNTHCVWNVGCGGAELVRDWWTVEKRLSTMSSSPASGSMGGSSPSGLPPLSAASAGPGPGSSALPMMGNGQLPSSGPGSQAMPMPPMQGASGGGSSGRSSAGLAEGPDSVGDLR